MTSMCSVMFLRTTISKVGLSCLIPLWPLPPKITLSRRAACFTYSFSIAAVRKNEHDLAIGNVVGSNLFNTLVVIGLAGVISPMGVGADVLYRDLPMVGLTVLLMLFCLRLNNRTGIGSLKGRVFFASWVGYTGWVSWTALAHL